MLNSVICVFLQCVKSKSVTNLAEATADPAIDLDPIVPGAVVDTAQVPTAEVEGGVLIGAALADIGEGSPDHVDDNNIT